MRFFQRRREKDADWLQQMEGNWSDRHGSCYEVFRDAAYKGTSYSCSVRIQRPSGEAEKEEKKKEETEEKEKAKEEEEEDQDLYAEAATEDTSEPSADAEAKQVATTAA
ncbi:hypothetical protein AK812_SmicGene13627 [Symbiodinium microadriaticum]|uniref:Uncharacterized protein n=1 Tax=Symbiodinium microadriaticum TaxID=2951 RepID=A0A1Q9E7Q7_SYMMI|nr:hypothetical protein AK812_SmicGene13627 [Symbiodinium microadriaticum]